MPLFHGSSSDIHYEQTGAGPDIVWVGGGGTQGKDWQRFQTPHFDRSFRSTVFDNRGIRLTACRAPLPWPIEDFASDLAELWPRLKSLLMEWMDSGENETSLVSQWDASLRFDQRSTLAAVEVPVHVIAFEEDVQAPPQDGAELARLIPGAVLHEMKGLGHGSWYGHAHDKINAVIMDILWQHA